MSIITHILISFCNNIKMSLEILMEPVEYYKQLNGKNIRKIFTHFLGKMFGISQDNIEQVDNIINITHNASLVIDDIEDASLTRRNHECAHIKYGIPLALNAGYLAFFKILNEQSEHMNSIMINNIYLAHIGQGMDIYYTTKKIVPSEEDYNTMMEYKTGILFKTIIDLLMDNSKNVLLKKRYNDLVLFSMKFSHFFQIRDDYINLTDIQYWKERGFCQDFDEEKISYIVMYYVNHKLEDHEQILQLLKQSKNNNEIKIQLLTLFDKSGVFDIIFDKLILLQSDLTQIMNVDMIFNQLPIHRFSSMDVSTFFA